MSNTSQIEFTFIDSEEQSKIRNLDKQMTTILQQTTKYSLEENYPALSNQLLTKDLNIIKLQKQLTSLKQLFVKEKNAKEELMQKFELHKKFIDRLPELKQLFVNQKQFIIRLKQLFIQEKKANKILNQQLEQQKQLTSQLEQQLKNEREAKGTLGQELERQKQLISQLEQQIKDLQGSATIGAIYLDKWRYRTYSNK